MEVIKMKRKFLEELGLEKEVVDKILDENMKDIGAAKGEADTYKQQLETAQKEVQSLTVQVKERDKQLETLKNSTGDMEQLKQEIATLQEGNKAAKQAHEAEMKRLRIDFAVDKALTGAKAKNITAVKALLKDIDKAVLDENGEVKGLQEQIDALVKDEGTSFLFETQTKPVFKGAKVGEGKDPGIFGGTDFKNMSSEEFMKYCNEHPEVNPEELLQ